MANRIARTTAASPAKRAPTLNVQQSRRPIVSRQSTGSDVPPSPASHSPLPSKAASVLNSSPGPLHAKPPAALASAVKQTPRTSSPLSIPSEQAEPAIHHSPSASPQVATSVPERLRPQPVSPSSSITPALVRLYFHFGIDISMNRCPFQRPPDDAEIQELRVKVRVLEAKRTDDARHIRELESQIEDAKNFIAVKPKLQLKLNQLQQDLIATKRDLADSQQLCQLAEGRVADAQDQLEMAMLDKEMAEEKSEDAQAELGEVQEKLAVLQVEMKVLKGGDESGGTTTRFNIFLHCLTPCILENSNADGEPSAKNSLAYIQLEKQNERLKEALIK